MLPVLALVATLSVLAQAHPLTRLRHHKRASVIASAPQVEVRKWSSWGSDMSSVAPGQDGEGGKCDELKVQWRCAGPTYQMVQLCYNNRWLNIYNCLAPEAPGPNCAALAGKDYCTPLDWDALGPKAAQDSNTAYPVRPTIYDVPWWGNGTAFRVGPFPGKVWTIMTEPEPKQHWTETGAAQSESEASATETKDPNAGWVGSGLKYSGSASAASIGSANSNTANSSSMASTTASTSSNGTAAWPEANATAAGVSSKFSASYTVHYRSTTTVSLNATATSSTSKVSASHTLHYHNTSTASATSAVSSTAAVFGNLAKNVTSMATVATTTLSASSSTPASTSAHSHALSVSASHSASSISINPAPTDKVGNVTSLVSFDAPHRVIYSDAWFASGRFPTASELGGFNRFILHVYMSSEGAQDRWVGLSDKERGAILEDYHASGIALMFSLFGSEDTPTTSGVAPAEFAEHVAQFARYYRFDGLDVDYEDFAAIDKGASASWVSTLTRALRAEMGPDFLISHAPTAPMFNPASVPDGAYATVHKTAGDDIDFYNIQYYNQGAGSYANCETIVTNSTGAGFPGTSLRELHEAGVPLHKLVLGKPIALKESTLGGYMKPDVLAQCVTKAREIGVDSVMFWQWSDAVNATQVLDTALGKSKGGAGFSAENDEEDCEEGVEDECEDDDENKCDGEDN